jgi:hypothetical protein
MGVEPITLTRQASIFADKLTSHFDFCASGRIRTYIAEAPILQTGELPVAQRMHKHVVWSLLQIDLLGSIGLRVLHQSRFGHMRVRLSSLSIIGYR